MYVKGKLLTLVARGYNYNYGAVLQAYALQHYLEALGIDSEYIDYNEKYLLSDTRKNKMTHAIEIIRNGGLMNAARSMYVYVINRSRFKLFPKRVNSFEKFKSRYIRFGGRSYKSFSDIKYDEAEITNDSFLLVGSDQVWNSSRPLDSLKVYLLTFTRNAPKLSYASSVAMPIRKELRSLYKEALSDFSAISVREQSSAEYLEEATGIKPEVVLDPTCLLDRSEWEQMALSVGEPVINVGNYILCYELYRGNEILAVVRKLARRYRMYLLHMFPTLPSLLNIGRCVSYFELGPQEFVRLIYESTFVVTSSFHGTVFAVIFKKPFYAVLPSTGHMNVSNERIIDFLKMLNLESRIIADPRQILSMPLDDCINWEEVHQILERERQRSAKFLRNAIDSALKAKGMNDR